MDTQELDRLLDRLTRIASSSESPAGDAIDRILGESPRATSVASLREHQLMRAVREQLAQGAISAETFGGFLEIVEAVLAGAK